MNFCTRTAVILFAASFLAGCCWAPGHYDPVTGMSYVGSLHFCHPNPAKAACRAQMRQQRAMEQGCGCNHCGGKNLNRQMRRCQRKMCRHNRRWEQCGLCVSTYGPMPIDGLCDPCGVCNDCCGQSMYAPAGMSCSTCGDGGYIPAGYMPEQVMPGGMMPGEIIDGGVPPVGTVEGEDLGAYFDGGYDGGYVSSTPPELHGGQVVYGGEYADGGATFSNGPSMPMPSHNCPNCQKSHATVPYETTPIQPVPQPTPADPPASGPRDAQPADPTPNAAWHTPPKWVPSRF